ncbi:MAG: ferredoxin oxidoreductase [archaeon]|nr:ferredoxin oxidoreductase [archaeon]MCP8305627.1 ferredoxin oxidoreductase [archaeon]
MKTVEPILLSGNLAAAYAIKQLDVDVVAAYPITPQTTIIEKISEYVADGELDANFMLVESEHSAISSCLSAASAGARVFTSTSSQGLLLMHEILFITSALRLPVVMAVANRSVSAPINIWCDHGDIMPQRDVGWIQLFAESAQEAYDKLIQAYRISEDPRVRLPVMVNADGIILSHTYEPVFPLEDSEVASFAPWKLYPLRLDPENPLTMGAFGYPEYYFETRYQSAKALEDSIGIISEVDEKFGEISGRKYGAVSPFRCEDADVILISMGSISETIRATVRKLREKGEKVGMMSLKLFRPFPFKEMMGLVKDAKAVGVVDRALSPGAIVGPVFNDITSALYLSKMSVPCVNFFTGLGGRDVRMADVRDMFEKLKEVAKTGVAKEHRFYVGLRG